MSYLAPEPHLTLDVDQGQTISCEQTASSYRGTLTFQIRFESLREPKSHLVTCYQLNTHLSLIETFEIANGEPIKRQLYPMINALIPHLVIDADELFFDHLTPIDYFYIYNTVFDSVVPFKQAHDYVGLKALELKPEIGGPERPEVPKHRERLEVSEEWQWQIRSSAEIPQPLLSQMDQDLIRYELYDSPLYARTSQLHHGPVHESSHELSLEPSHELEDQLNKTRLDEHSQSGIIWQVIHPTTLFLDDQLAGQALIRFEFVLGASLYPSSHFISPPVFFMVPSDAHSHLAHELFSLAERAGIMLRPDLEERFGSLIDI